MKLAVTLMVRDEADIIQQWLDYHVAQGVDLLVITDNGSEDGTREVLEAFAASGRVEVDLRHDPVHRKQQSTTVTRMAREAFTQHGADWVVNADADEFLMPKDRSLSLHDVFTRLDPDVNAFVVPVVNMVGRMAKRGAGIDRLVWRDERSPEELRAVGLLAQPSGNAIHVGNAEVSVVQGNHLVTMPNHRAPDEALALEVLHLPWRSWAQYEHRVEIAGRAYASNPDLVPSPNHHGMRDYRRLGQGILPAYYALRHISDADAEHGGFRRDESLVDYFASIGKPVGSYGGDTVMPRAEAARLTAIGRALSARDVLVEDTAAELAAATENVRLMSNTVQHLNASVQHQQERIAALEALANARERELTLMRARRVVRVADRAGDLARRVRTRLQGS
ncbi:glycosyltransferase family 2 protein [Curtobacterium sp. RRHDQ10]|uniref:glycosyltransferase family 2 protein n=1 Tax=Curtobacterium phyllosphaerae TaxID=3413379 RepID=UPI003BF2DB3F